MSIESALAEITSRDWYVYTLRECVGDRPSMFRWECTLRDAVSKLVAFGQGPTCEDALSMAIDGIDRAEPGVLPTFTIHKSAPANSLAEILSRVKPAVRIERRKL